MANSEVFFWFFFLFSLFVWGESNAKNPALIDQLCTNCDSNESEREKK